MSYKLDLRIQNIVATVTLDQDIDIYTLEKTLPDTEYEPEQFPGLVYKLENPKTTLLIFRTGKVVIAGAKNIDDVIDATKKLVKLLKQTDIELPQKPNIQIQNIVATSNLHANVYLEKAASLLENTMYEPEQFPGLIYKLNEPNAVLLIFSSGKVVIAGVRREEDIIVALNKVYDTLLRNDCIRKEEESLTSE